MQCGFYRIVGVMAAALLGLISQAQAQNYTEVPVTPTVVGDTEFDWGRDGISCPTCNFGQGNNRLNWTERTNVNNGNGLIVANVWLAHIDPSTGAMPTQSAKDEFVDGEAAFWNSYGNGPEWAFSTQNGVPVSQLVYTRFANGNPSIGNSGAALATQTSGSTTNGWQANFFPGALTANCSGPTGSCYSNLPEASQCLGDSDSLAMFKNFVTTPYQQVFLEPVSTATGTAPSLMSIMNSNGIGERFVPCTPWLLYQGSATLGTHTYQQVFFYDTSGQIPTTQLTTDNASKFSGFMFQAPDFGNNYIFFTISNRQVINVYEQFGTQANGAPNFQLVNQIQSNDPNEIYINSPEPFINCTPVCTTYIFMTVARTSDAQNGNYLPIGLAIATLDPNNPMFTVLESIKDTPLIQREDPEYFITANGPYIYYSRIHVAIPTSAFKNEGLYYVDTRLGAPSGPCVGSSAEGGLLQTPACIEFLANGQQVAHAKALAAAHQQALGHSH